MASVTWAKSQHFHDEWLKTADTGLRIQYNNIMSHKGWRYHTWVLLSGVCGKEWGVDLLSNAVTRELLGCRVVKRNKKAFRCLDVIWDLSCLSSKNKVKSCVHTARLCAGNKPRIQCRELSLSPEAACHQNQITLHRWCLKSEPYQNHQQTTVGFSDWFWSRDAVLLTMKGNMQISIQETVISPFSRAAGPLGNETHVLIIEDADMIFICATAVCVLRVVGD